MRCGRFRACAPAPRRRLLRCGGAGRTSTRIEQVGAARDDALDLPKGKMAEKARN
jgi:hypothetical protein